MLNYRRKLMFGIKCGIINLKKSVGAVIILWRKNYDCFDCRCVSYR